MNADLFIRTYWKDLDWLELCLASISKYCRGFRAIIVVIPSASNPWLRRFALPGNVEIKTCRNYKDDYLGQQVTKLFADAFTDADLICHIDSDCIFSRVTSPEDLVKDGKPCIFLRPYELLGRHHPWQKPTEQFLGWSVRNDFMQQPPFLYPRWLYPQLREHAVAVHGVDLETYITRQPARGFSEFNVLGAFAWQRHRERFTWIDTSVTPAGDPVCRWYWSWGGIDDSACAEIRAILDARDV